MTVVKETTKIVSQPLQDSRKGSSLHSRETGSEPVVPKPVEKPKDIVTEKPNQTPSVSPLDNGMTKAPIVENRKAETPSVSPLSIVERHGALPMVERAKPQKSDEQEKTKKKKKGFKEVVSIKIPANMNHFVNALKAPLQEVEKMMNEDEKLQIEDSEAQLKFHSMRL